MKNSVEANVHNQVAFALGKFEPEIKTGKLALIGAVYDFRNDYKQGYGRLVIVNVNGETDVSKFRKSDLFSRNYWLDQSSPKNTHMGVNERVGEAFTV